MTLIIGTTSLAMLYYGWALPVTVNSKSGSHLGMWLREGSFPEWLLISGVGFMVPFIVTSNVRVTPGMSTLAIQGGIRGIVDSWLFNGLLKGKEFMDGETPIGIGMAGSLAELGVGYAIADVLDLSAGTASMISIGGNVGLGLGIETFAVITAEPPLNSDAATYTICAMALGGSALGYFAGAKLAAAHHYTAGDASVFTTAALIGAGAPPALASLTNSEDSHLYLGLSMAGCIAGCWFAHDFLADRDFSSAQGNYVSPAGLVSALSPNALRLRAPVPLVGVSARW
jgi:hypothetical protein